MSEFKNYHPIVNFVYFLFVIILSMTAMHPVCLIISFLSAFSYSVFISGKRQLKSALVYMIPVFLLTAIINPLFNHEGITIITYLPGGNPLTLESVIYGLCSACMIINVIQWFSVYNKIMTSDKFIYLFGRIIPSMSLIISMTLRFVPSFAAQLKVVSNAQKSIGRDISHGNLLQRAKHGLTILSIMVTWALENAVDTADSMKSRGYGNPGRTSFSVFKFDMRDLRALLYILITGIYTVVGSFCGTVDFTYFPVLKAADMSLYGASVFAAYLILCISPLIIEFWEVRKWNALKSKI